MTTINPKPKPVKQPHARRVTEWAICPLCGAISAGKRGFVEVHQIDCSREFGGLHFRKRKTERQLMTEALDFLTREIVRWRDSLTCVQKNKNCRGAPTWGHVLNQAGHPAIVWNLRNSYMQCEGHNHRHGPQQKYEDYYDWFKTRWGQAEWDKLVELGKRPALSVIEMRERLQELRTLWENRPSVYTTQELKRLGYYS